MKIGILTAMSSERTQLEKLLGDLRIEEGDEIVSLSEEGVSRRPRRSFRLGRLHGNEIVLVESGIGKVNAALGAAELIRRYRPDCLISTGVAGGIDTSLAVADIVAASEIVYHDVDCGIGNEYGQVQGLPARFPCDRRLYDLALAVRSEVAVHGGLICSGDQFVSERSKLDAIKARFPEGLAVEMESGAIAQTCYLLGVPFLSFRIVSDTPDGDNSSEHYTRYENFWQVMADRSFAVTKAFLESLPTSLQG